ncbi:MAG: hypothetical protein KBB94_06400 [Legionellaceae bacterium]|nr:hypothetical protein [Legionellaceae bacterium]MBP9775769.1 hypothetical protein [Legionellaceae bacterium]
MRDKTPGMLKAESDIWDEFGSNNWISSDPSSQAILMAAKRESRLEKMHPFHGFVLEQKTLEDSEFAEFVHKLKDSAAQIPPGTRMQLAVLTDFIDPDYEWSAEYAEGKRTCAHWTAIDLMVDEHGEVHSFVLDAANSYGYARMHDTLKATFPDGNHYVYKVETLGSDDQKRVSPIQTQKIGCRVFTVEHLKQLSQIDTETLYGKELPMIAEQNGVVKASKFKGDLKLSRIFRGMQTWTGLNALPKEVKETVVKEKTGETLLQYAERQSETKGGFKPIKSNETISRKNIQYINKKRDYYNSLSQENQERIIEDRQGFTFLNHPQLFRLSAILADIDTTDNRENMLSFIANFSEKLEKAFSQDVNHITTQEGVQQCLQELSLISSDKKPGAIKSAILLAVSDLYLKLEKSPNPFDPLVLSSVIEACQAATSNPATAFRARLRDTFDSSSDSDSNHENSPS